MWPWGHAVVGYVLYSAGVHAWQRRAPDDAAVLAVLFGTQFPDLVDKPLAWSFDLLPSGRSLAHSSLTAAVVVGALWLLARRQRRIVAAFAVGYASHLITDLPAAVFHGAFDEAAYLLWPLLPPPPYEHDMSFLEQFRTIELTPEFLVQIALFLPCFLLWRHDGYPGLRALQRGVGWLLSPATAK